MKQIQRSRWNVLKPRWSKTSYLQSCIIHWLTLHGLCFLRLRILMLPLLMEALFWATDVLYKRKREQLHARHGFLSALSFCIDLVSAKAVGFSSTAQTADLKCLSGAFQGSEFIYFHVWRLDFYPNVICMCCWNKTPRRRLQNKIHCGPERKLLILLIRQITGDTCENVCANISVTWTEEEGEAFSDREKNNSCI